MDLYPLPQGVNNGKDAVATLREAYRFQFKQLRSETGC